MGKVTDDEGCANFISTHRKRRQGGDKYKTGSPVNVRIPGTRPNSEVNVDQLAWKKISLQHDEFDDFEEIEGVDVEYVEKDGNKVVKFKESVPRQGPMLTLGPRTFKAGFQETETSAKSDIPPGRPAAAGRMAWDRIVRWGGIR